jgi:hypothetical protein
VPSTLNVGRMDSPPHIGEVVGYRYLFFLIFGSKGTRTADTGRSTPTYYDSIDAVSPKDVPFGGFNAKILYLGSYSPKPPSFFRRNGLNVQSNNFRRARPILVLRSSNDASTQKQFKYAAKLLKFVFFFGRVTTKKLPKGCSLAKILHSITF